MPKKPIYLDYNATTPLAPEVADAMRPFLTGMFGNPSSDHFFGSEAKKALEKARGQVAGLLGASPDEIVFTSGGTEANNLAIMGAARAAKGRDHIVCSAIEHPAILEVVRFLEREGFRLSIIGVDSSGRLNLDALEKAVGESTIIVSIMLANNEVGTVQEIRKIAEIVRARGALMHTDAAQAIGKIPVRVDSLQVDLLSIAGHKFYAPKGVGALYIRSGTSLAKQTHGANHEHGLRPGTENVMFAAALGTACSLAPGLVEKTMPGLRRMRDRFEATLLDKLGPERVRINSAAATRLPNTSSVSFHRVEANTLLSEVGSRVAASAGAACHADAVEVSSVISAMGISDEWAMGTVRFSLGAGTTEDDIDKAANIVCRAARQLSGDRVETAAGAPSETDIRLTAFTKGMGCACKVRPQVLERILESLPVRPDPNVVVDTSTSDDASVYVLTDEIALVQTADFFTPVVDDPYSFGAIAAANALSDIYAMNARPLYAVNIVGFPTERLPERVLREILRGAADKCAEAGISIVGGHTIEDVEPKFGLAVTGTAHPSGIVRNSTAAVGDVLVLTKPLGTGIVSTGIKRGLAEGNDERDAIAVMASLNRAAADAMNGLSVHACTDVTGFGFLGHLFEMLRASKVAAEISASEVPILEAAKRLAAARVVPGGTMENLDYVEAHVRFFGSVSQSTKWILADAQTSGGLLISLAEAEADALLKLLHEAGNAGARKVGKVVAGEPGAIRVIE